MILTLYEPFRHWSETGSVYILSDPHFGDSDCKLMNPGWIEPEEQVARINALVMKNDTFVCLANVCDYTPVSLGKLIKGGILSDITSIHRITIDRATEKKEKWHGEAVSDN